MAYFGNTNSYSAPSTSGEFGTYPSWGQASVTEETGELGRHTFANGWGVGAQPGPMVGSPTGLRAETSFCECHYNLLTNQHLTRESSASAAWAASYAAPTHGCNQPSYPEHYLSTTGQYAEPHHSGVTNQDNSFVNTMASETSTVIPIPSGCKYLFCPYNFGESTAHRSRTDPLNYWGTNQSGPSSSTFYTVSAQTSPPSHNPADAFA